MEKVFGDAYMGDPGVPHSGPDGFTDAILGVAAFTVYSMFDPYYWQKTTAHHWHDIAMCHENHRFKQAMKKKQPYDPVWNKMMPKKVRDNYYQIWSPYMI